MSPWLFVIGVAVIGCAPIIAAMIGAREPGSADPIPKPHTDDTIELPRIK